MSIEKAIRDYEGSYTLGQADGEIWAFRAHPNEVQSLSLISVEDVGQMDITGKHQAQLLLDQAATYRKKDPRFVQGAYCEGFLTSVRKVRTRYAFAMAKKGTRA